MDMRLLGHSQEQRVNLVKRLGSVHLKLVSRLGREEQLRVLTVHPSLHRDRLHRADLRLKELDSSHPDHPDRKKLGVRKAAQLTGSNKHGSHGKPQPHMLHMCMVDSRELTQQYAIK